MAETPKQKKQGFGFLIMKGSIFNIFQNGKKLHTQQLHTSSVYELQYSCIKSDATIWYILAFFPKKESLIFKIKKNND